MFSKAFYRLTEPQPSTGRYHTGRGGAGNAYSAKSKPAASLSRTSSNSSSASESAAAAASISSSKVRPDAATDGTAPPPTQADAQFKPLRYYHAGRGGAGNVSAGERAIFSFDEELRRHQARLAPVYYHVGRGGAGNAMREEEEEEQLTKQRKNAASASMPIKRSDAFGLASGYETDGDDEALVVIRG